jgi:hypothetical protein
MTNFDSLLSRSGSANSNTFHDVCNPCTTNGCCISHRTSVTTHWQVVDRTPAGVVMLLVVDRALVMVAVGRRDGCGGGGCGCGCGG